MNIEFEKIWSILKQSFDMTVLRKKEVLKKMLDAGKCEYTLEVSAKKEILGVLLWSNLKDFIFFEYLAIIPEMRSRGLGNKMLSRFLNSKKMPVVLEVETPVCEEDYRRIDFYKRLDFHFNDYPYTIPPFHLGDKPIELKIMSYPSPLSFSEFSCIRETLMRRVYSFS